MEELEVIGRRRLRKCGSIALLLIALFFLLNLSLLPPSMDAWRVVRYALLLSIPVGVLAIWTYPKPDMGSKYEAKIVAAIYAIGVGLFLFNLFS